MLGCLSISHALLALVLIVCREWGKHNIYTDMGIAILVMLIGYVVWIR